MSFIGTLSTLFNNSNASIQGANAAQQQYWNNISNYMGGLNNAFATNLQALAHNYWMNNPQYLRELHDLQRQNEIAKLKMSISNMSNANAQGSRVNGVLGQSGFNVPNSGVMPNGENGFNVTNNNANQTTNNPQAPSQKPSGASTIVYDPNNPPQTTVINPGQINTPTSPDLGRYLNQNPVFQEQDKQTQSQAQATTNQVTTPTPTPKLPQQQTIVTQTPTNKVTTPISNPTLPQQAPTPKLPQQQTTVAQTPTPTPTPKLPQQQTIVTQTPTPTPTPAPVVVTQTPQTSTSSPSLVDSMQTPKYEPHPGFVYDQNPYDPVAEWSGYEGTAPVKVPVAVTPTSSPSLVTSMQPAPKSEPHPGFVSGQNYYDPVNEWSGYTGVTQGQPPVTSQTPTPNRTYVQPAYSPQVVDSMSLDGGSLVDNMVIAPTPTPAPVVVTPTTPTQASNTWDFFGNLSMPVPGTYTFEQAIAMTQDPINLVNLLSKDETIALNGVASARYFGTDVPAGANPNMVNFVNSLNPLQLKDVMYRSKYWNTEQVVPNAPAQVPVQVIDGQEAVSLKDLPNPEGASVPQKKQQTPKYEPHPGFVSGSNYYDPVAEWSGYEGTAPVKVPVAVTPTSSPSLVDSMQTPKYEPHPGFVSGSNYYDPVAEWSGYEGTTSNDGTLSDLIVLPREMVNVPPPDKPTASAQPTISQAWDSYGNLGQMPVPGNLTFEQAIATTRDPVSVISLLNPKERSILRTVASSQYFGFKMPDEATPNMVAFVGSLNPQQLYDMMNKF